MFTRSIWKNSPIQCIRSIHLNEKGLILSSWTSSPYGSELTSELGTNHMRHQQHTVRGRYLDSTSLHLCVRYSSTRLYIWWQNRTHQNIVWVHFDGREFYFIPVLLPHSTVYGKRQYFLSSQHPPQILVHIWWCLRPLGALPQYRATDEDDQQHLFDRGCYPRRSPCGCTLSFLQESWWAWLARLNICEIRCVHHFFCMLCAGACPWSVGGGLQVAGGGWRVVGGGWRVVGGGWMVKTGMRCG